MGTYENFYLNKIKKLQEENEQLRKILREAEVPSALPPIIPTPEVSPPDSPARGYAPFDPANPYNLSPMKPSPTIKPLYGPYRIPSLTRPIAPEDPPVTNPSPYR
jgi:hypothetical protein